MSKQLLFLTVLMISIGCNTLNRKSQSDESVQSDDQSKNETTDYQSFLERLKSNEPYIGFFAAEDTYIKERTAGYLEARKKCFLGINKSKEEPFDYAEAFIEFCTDEGLLNAEDQEEWEKILTVLSFEMYPNTPIFEFDSDKIIEHRNLIYAEYPNKKLALDLFLPEKPVSEPVPIVICIHGGGWVVNRRIWFEPFAKYLADKGLAAITIDYRKLPAVELRDIVGDTKAAVRWVRANADEYGLDPDKIGAIGASAGAHLVTLLGTTADEPELEGTGGNGDHSSAIHAVFGIATPGFTPSTSKKRIDRFGFSENDFNMLSPYQNIDASSAPLYLLHGTADETVPPQNSSDIRDRYEEFGVHVELEWVPNEGHGFYEGTDFAISRAATFFLTQLSDQN